MNEELTGLIIKELRKHRERRAIIEKVCEQSNLNWKDAERLIILIEAQQKRTIAVQPTPLLLFFSIGSLLLGLGLLAFNLYPILAQGLSLPGNLYPGTRLFTGVGMTIAGMISLWKAFGRIFPR